MQIEIKRSFLKDLKKLPITVQQSALELLDALEQVTHPCELTHCKKIQGTPEHYRIRIGDYRVGLRVENDILFIVRCLHRKSIYRFFP